MVKRNVFLFKVFVSVSFLFLMFFVIDFNLMFKALAKVAVADYSFVFFVFVTSILIVVVRWKMFIEKYSFVLLLKYTFLSYYYSLVLPGQIAGSAAKAYLFGRGKKDAERIAASVAVEKLTGLLSLILLAFVGAFFSSSDTAAVFLNIFVFLFFVFLAVLFVFEIDFLFKKTIGFIARIKTKYQRLESLLSRVELLVRAYKDYSGRKRLLLTALLLGVLFQILCVFIYMLLAGGIGFHLSFFDWCWIHGVISVVLLLPITIGGLGLREAGMVGVLGLLSVKSEQAMALSLLVFSLFVIAAFAGGIIDTYRRFRGGGDGKKR